MLKTRWVLRLITKSKTSPILLSLKATYFESIGETDESNQIICKLIDGNGIHDAEKRLGLINYLLIVCKRSPNFPWTRANKIENYCSKVTQDMTQVDDSCQLPVHSGRNRPENHRKKSENFPAGILLPQNHRNHPQTTVSGPDCSTLGVMASVDSTKWTKL